MVSKILVGALGLAVLGTGGYFYMASLERSDCPSHSCTASQNVKSAPSCCSSTQAISVEPSCCSDLGEEVVHQNKAQTPEILSIEPREIK